MSKSYLDILKEILQKPDDKDKWVGLYYLIITESGFYSESCYGVLREVSDDFIRLESLGMNIIPTRNVFIYRIVTK